MSLCGILFIILLILKLTGRINWSWIWVFSPIWITMFFTFFWWIALLILICACTNFI